MPQLHLPQRHIQQVHLWREVPWWELHPDAHRAWNLVHGQHQWLPVLHLHCQDWMTGWQTHGVRAKNQQEDLYLWLQTSIRSPLLCSHPYHPQESGVAILHVPRMHMCVPSVLSSLINTPTTCWIAVIYDCKTKKP